MIIDAHAHYVSPRVIEALRTAPGANGASLVEGETGPQIFFNGAAAPVRPMAPTVRDLAQRRERMRAQGVDLQVVSTWFELYGYQLPPELGAAWCRLLNQTMAEDLGQPEHRDAFLGLANVPLQDGARAADELEYAVTELGFKGAMIAPNVFDRLLDDPDLDPLWRKAEQLRAFVMIHPYAPHFGFRTGRYYLDNILSNPFDTTIAACSIIFGGVADHFPDLRIMLVHGGGFFPYQIGRVDRGYTTSSVKGHSTKAPVEYLRWFQYDTMLMHAPAVKYLTEQVGASEVLLGSDFPFPMSDTDPVTTVRAAGLSPADERLILEENARRLLDLPD
jgi:aminocarboxymuconate-semialdehyde decarboxylase